MLSPASTIKSVQLGRIPRRSPNSYASPRLAAITPVVAERTVFALLKKIRYCVLSGTTTLSNSSTSVRPWKRRCTGLLIVPNSTSPILSVPATVLSPSGPKNTISPANSWMVNPLIHPISRVTGCTTKSAIVLPVSRKMRSSQKIYSWSRNGNSPVMSLSTLIVPAPLAVVKSSSVNGAVNTNSCGVLDMPAKNSASLNPVTNFGLLGAPVAFRSVTVVPSYLVALFAPSAHTIKSVPPRL